MGVCGQVWVQEIPTPESGGGTVPGAESDPKTSHPGIIGGKQCRQVAQMRMSSLPSSVV